MKKKFFQISILLVVLAITAVSVASALDNSGETDNLSETTIVDNPIMVSDSMPAALSVAAMYAPNQTYGEAYWRDMVCTGMTDGGCAYFKSNQASEMWASQLGHAADFVDSVTKVGEINDAAQVWQAHITIFVTTQEKIEQDIYVLVGRGEDGRWYLERVLSG